MNIIYYLLQKFFYEEKLQTGGLLSLSLLITLIQTNVISVVTANIIQSIEKKSMSVTMQNFRVFMFVSVFFIIIYYIYRIMQNNLVTKMMQWIKHEVFKVILMVNNEDMCHVNFVEFITPITRISVSCYILFYDLLSTIMPTIGFLLVISGFFLYKNAFFGSMFLLGNAFLVLYTAYYWNDMVEYKNRQEDMINRNEKYLVDILNNVDKVIYRGQVKNEIDTFMSKTAECIGLSNQFSNFVTRHTMTMTAFVYAIIFTSIFYLIHLRFANRITTTIFISFFTVLLLYRDKILNTINNIPDYLEFMGRLDYIIGTFDNMLGDKQNVQEIVEKVYEPVNLTFDTIDFNNVSFEYKKTDKVILDNFSIHLDIGKKIIGITGLSGKGKSSFVKLILRLYNPTSGSIRIDGHNIEEIDPIYLRKNITYVNQNSKLFDKKVMDNILYGCNDHAECNKHLDEILKHAKIQELFQNVDIKNANVGSLGENLSGGQRQVINLISGLINPSQILILDEPTNALDIDLKRHVLSLIKQFKPYKKSIIIITHDQDVFPLFDENVRI